MKAPGKAVLVSAMGLVPSAQLQGCFASEPKKILSGYAVRFFWFGKPLHQCSRSPILSLASAPPPFSGRSIGSRGAPFIVTLRPGAVGCRPVTPHYRPHRAQSCFGFVRLALYHSDVSPSGCYQ